MRRYLESDAALFSSRPGWRRGAEQESAGGRRKAGDAAPPSKRPRAWRWRRWSVPSARAPPPGSFPRGASTGASAAGAAARFAAGNFRPRSAWSATLYAAGGPPPAGVIICHWRQI